MPREHSQAGWTHVRPSFAAGFAALGIHSAHDFLELPGEIVCGHPDRHVVRVDLPSFDSAFYLKRQHAVRLRERWRNRRAGFGWVSRSGREWEVLKQLEGAGLPCPRWVAAGEDNQGRAFLLIEELRGAVDLRRMLQNNLLAACERTVLACRIGRLIAQILAAGITMPDLSAKHLLISPGAQTITPIDWQNAQSTRPVSQDDRVRALAVLHASVAEALVSPRERLRVLRQVLGPDRRVELTRRVCAEAERLTNRRSIREQRTTTADSQRLVWLDGEAVCAIPEIAAEWPKPASAAPFYGEDPGSLSIRLPDGRSACLVRGRSRDPIGRLRAWLRGRSWRSPAATLGRLLFHLERHHVPAPRLLAFGQKLTGVTTAEWFVLHTEPCRSSVQAEALGTVLRRLHDAGCRVAGDPLAALGVDEQDGCVRAATAIRLPRRVSARDRAADLQALLARLDPPLRARTAARYHYASPPCPRNTTRRLEVSASG